NPGAAERRAVLAAREHGGNAVEEFGLADATQRGRPVRAVHVAALDYHGGSDVVTAGGKILQKMREQVAGPDPIPDMVVRVDDRPAGLDRLFGLSCVSAGHLPTGGQIRSASTGERGAWVNAGMNCLVQAMPSG